MQLDQGELGDSEVAQYDPSSGGSGVAPGGEKGPHRTDDDAGGGMSGADGAGGGTLGGQDPGGSIDGEGIGGNGGGGMRGDDADGSSSTGGGA